MSTPTVGVLALQGDVREHLAALESCGVRATRVRDEDDLAAVDALVLPGGESTTIDKLLRVFELDGPLRERLRAGMPAYGSCAGMILLADRIVGGIEGQRTLGGLDITVRRNAFGRQVDSFETDLTFDEIPGSVADPVHAVFIRAPWVDDIGPDVHPLARVESGPSAGRIVAVRQGSLLATSFHPEVTGDTRVHRLFVEIVRDAL